MSGATKAEAYRWFDAHVGRLISTNQVAARGGVWSPGPRWLHKAGAQAWRLDHSHVCISPTHKVLSIQANVLVLEWRDEAGELIHTTVYTAVAA